MYSAKVMVIYKIYFSKARKEKIAFVSPLPSYAIDHDVILKLHHFCIFLQAAMGM